MYDATSMYAHCDTTLLSLFLFALNTKQVRLHYIEEFSKKTSLSSLLSQDVGQTAMNISEQIFSIYP